MAPLTEEERQHIVEEERVRAEARAQFAGGKQNQKKGFGHRKLKHPFLTGLGIIAALITVISLLASSGGEDKKPVGSVVEEKTVSKQAGAPSTPEEKIKSLVATEIKGQNSNKQERLREVTATPMNENSDLYFVRIFFNADENLTVNLKKKGIELQMAKLYHQLYTSGLPIGRVVIQANTMLVDQYGNEHDTRVYETSLNKAEADKINWSTDRTTLQMQIIPGVWTSAYIHSVYQK